MSVSQDTGRKHLQWGDLVAQLLGTGSACHYSERKKKTERERDPGRPPAWPCPEKQRTKPVIDDLNSRPLCSQNSPGGWELGAGS